MKKILGLCILLCLQATYSYAEVEKKNVKIKREFCEEILGAALFNKVLEEVCGFEGGVKDKLKNIYDSGNCRSVVPQTTVDNLAKEVLLDSRDRYKVFGEKKFCEDNLRGYADLMD